MSRPLEKWNNAGFLKFFFIVFKIQVWRIDTILIPLDQWVKWFFQIILQNVVKVRCHSHFKGLNGVWTCYLIKIFILEGQAKSCGTNTSEYSRTVVDSRWLQFFSEQKTPVLKRIFAKENYRGSDTNCQRLYISSTLFDISKEESLITVVS